MAHWCGVLCCVCSQGVLSVPSPANSFSSVSVVTLCTCYGIGCCTVGLVSAPTRFSILCVPSEAANSPQSLNGSITTHSFQFECFRTSFCWCVCCGSIFSSCAFRKANWNLGYFKTHSFRITLGRRAELFTCPPVGPCHSFSTWMFQIFFPLVSYLVCLLLTSCFCSQPGSHAAFVITRTIGEKPQTWCVSEPGHQIQNELLTCQSRGW